MARQHGLGRGLSSLIPQKNTQGGTPRQTVQDALDAKKQDRQRQRDDIHDEDNSGTDERIRDARERTAQQNSGPRTASVDSIALNSQQPRMHFDEEKLDELTQSIRAHGIIQPLIVIQKGSQYELIAGERRLQAAKRAGLEEVPIVVHEDVKTEQKKLELALIENIQRHDLNAIEEARAYKKFADEFNLSQEEIATRTGKSRSVVANRMRLLNLPIEVQRALIAGKISEGHAKAILALENPQKQRALFDLIISQKLTVRESEGRAQGSAVRSHRRREKEAYIVDLESQLTEDLGTKVRITGGRTTGKMSIAYSSEEELSNIAKRLQE